MAKRTIIVTDERPELGTIREVVRFENVSAEWDTKTIIERHGIAEHLTVYSTTAGGPRRIIQNGRRLAYNG